VEKIKFEHGIELERAGEGEYVLKLKIPQIKVFPEQTGSHIKQAKKEALLALRSIIDKAIKVEEEKSGE
jgi:hypothetical protein